MHRRNKEKKYQLDIWSGFYSMWLTNWQAKTIFYENFNAWLYS